MPMDEKPKPAPDEAAHHLEDLLEQDAPECGVDGCAGDLYSAQAARELLSGTRRLPGFDVDRDLSNPYAPMRKRDAAFILLAYLLRAGPQERSACLEQIQPVWLPDPLARFLYHKICEHASAGEGWTARVQSDLEACGQAVFGQPLNPTLRLSVYNWWFTTLATAPTSEQFNRALSILAGLEVKKDESR